MIYTEPLIIFWCKKKHTISSIRVTIHEVAPPIPNVHGGVFFTYCNALQEQEDN